MAGGLFGEGNEGEISGRPHTDVGEIIKVCVCVYTHNQSQNPALFTSFLLALFLSPHMILSAYRV